MSPYHAKKRFGQNFLKSDDIIKRIIENIDPLESENIIEIGPGRGALTEHLVKSKALVNAVEFDRDLIPALKRKFEGCDNLKITHADFLEYEPDESPFKLVGNIPYNITSPIIDWTVYYHDDISSVYLMMQKEMAQRLASSPGSKDWSPMSILTQLYFKIEILFDISPKHFDPAPKVTSSFVKLIPVPVTDIKNYKAFSMVVRQAFKQRRKTLYNNFYPEVVENGNDFMEILTKLGYDKKIRAEQFSTNDFLKLTDSLVGYNILSYNEDKTEG